MRPFASVGENRGHRTLRPLTHWGPRLLGSPVPAQRDICIIGVICNVSTVLMTTIANGCES